MLLGSMTQGLAAADLSDCELLKVPANSFSIYCFWAGELHFNIEAAGSGRWRAEIVRKVPQLLDQATPMMKVGPGGQIWLHYIDYSAVSRDFGASWSPLRRILEESASDEWTTCSSRPDAEGKTWDVMQRRRDGSGRLMRVSGSGKLLKEWKLKAEEWCGVFPGKSEAERILASSAGVFLLDAAGSMRKAAVRRPKDLDVNEGSFYKPTSSSCVDRYCWLCYSTGVLLRSEDGGRSWDLISREGQMWAQPLALNFGKVQFLTAAEGYWLGADRVLRLTRDGGDHWTPFVEGKGEMQDFFCLDKSRCVALSSSGVIYRIEDGKVTLR